jgi:hypothetical protein
MSSLKNYLEKRKKSKLFKQWVQKSRLPAEEIPPELRDTQVGTPGESLNNEDNETADIYSSKRGMINIPIKYLLLMVLIIAILLIALSVVTTLLIAGS